MNAAQLHPCVFFERLPLSSFADPALNEWRLVAIPSTDPDRYRCSPAPPLLFQIPCPVISQDLAACTDSPVPRRPRNPLACPLQPPCCCNQFATGPPLLSVCPFPCLCKGGSRSAAAPASCPNRQRPLNQLFRSAAVIAMPRAPQGSGAVGSGAACRPLLGGVVPPGRASAASSAPACHLSAALSSCRCLLLLLADVLDLRHVEGVAAWGRGRRGGRWGRAQARRALGRGPGRRRGGGSSVSLDAHAAGQGGVLASHPCARPPGQCMPFGKSTHPSQTPPASAPPSSPRPPGCSQRRASAC